MLLGFHPQNGDAGAALVHVLQRVFILVLRCALVRGRRHVLHPLTHGRVRMGVRVRSGVEEAVGRVVRLKALSWTHEARHAVHRRGAGQGGGEPGVQGQGAAHGAHAAVELGLAVEGEHGRVVQLHGAGVHFLLTTPFCSAVLEPHLEDKEQTHQP